MKLTEKLTYKSVNEEDEKAKEIIKELIDTGWSGDNESQMKAVQLLKGLATSDSPEANAFMKKLDQATSAMGEGLEENLTGITGNHQIKLLVSNETMKLIDMNKKKELMPIVNS